MASQMKVGKCMMISGIYKTNDYHCIQMHIIKEKLSEVIK